MSTVPKGFFGHVKRKEKTKVSISLLLGTDGIMLTDDRGTKEPSTSQSFSYFVRGNDPSAREGRTQIIRWELVCKKSEIIYRVDLAFQMIQTNCILGSEGTRPSDVCMPVANTF